MSEACPDIADLQSIDDLAGLAAALRQLRRRHARQRGDSPLTYRELAARTGWALGVIGDYFGGKALPSTDRLDDLARLLGAAPAEQGALATARDRIEEHRRAAGPVRRRGSREWLQREEAMLVAAVRRAAGLDLAAARLAGTRAAEAGVERGLGQLRYQRDDFGQARRHFRSALVLAELGEDLRGTADALAGLGTVHRRAGQHHAALPVLSRAATLLGTLADQAGAARVAYQLGCAHLELGHFALALDHLAAAVRAGGSGAERRRLASALRGVALVHRARGELAGALEYCAAADRAASTLDDPRLACYLSQATAKVWIRLGDPDRALDPLRAALSTCTALHDRFGAALVRRTLGEAWLAAGRPDLALPELRAAEAGWRALNHALGAARTQRDIGAALASRGDCPAAHRTWAAAMRTFRTLNVREAAELDSWRHRWGCGCTHWHTTMHASHPPTRTAEPGQRRAAAAAGLLRSGG